MLIRQTLNFATHFVAGLAVGALVVVAIAGCARCRRRDRDDAFDPVPHERTSSPTMPRPTGGDGEAATAPAA